MNEPMDSPSAKSTKPAPFAYDGLERVIHEKARLGILASLASHAAGLAFSELKQLCALTDGNLNRHLQVLQDAGLVEVQKLTDGPRPQTVCHVTDQGRSRFAEYISVLEKVVQDALLAQRSELARVAQSVKGWKPA